MQDEDFSHGAAALGSLHCVIWNPGVGGTALLEPPLGHLVNCLRSLRGLLGEDTTFCSKAWLQLATLPVPTVDHQEAQLCGWDGQLIIIFVKKQKLKFMLLFCQGRAASGFHIPFQNNMVQ